MRYDFQLVSGALLLVLACVSVANAFVEERSPLYSFIAILIAGALIGWAWIISDQTLTVQDVPNSIFRVLSYWFN